MKKFLMILPLFLLAVSCGKEKPEVEPDPEGTTTTTVLSAETKVVERTVNAVILASENSEMMAQLELEVNTVESLTMVFGGSEFTYRDDDNFNLISAEVDTSDKQRLSGDKWEKGNMVFMYRVYQANVVAEVPASDPVSVTVTDAYNLYDIPDYSSQLFLMALEEAAKEAGVHKNDVITGKCFITGATVDISPMDYDVELTVDYDFYFN